MCNRMATLTERMICKKGRSDDAKKYNGLLSFLENDQSTYYTHSQDGIFVWQYLNILDESIRLIGLSFH